MSDSTIRRLERDGDERAQRARERAPYGERLSVYALRVADSDCLPGGRDVELAAEVLGQNPPEDVDTSIVCDWDRVNERWVRFGDCREMWLSCEFERWIRDQAGRMAELEERDREACFWEILDAVTECAESEANDAGDPEEEDDTAEGLHPRAVEIGARHGASPGAGFLAVVSRGAAALVQELNMAGFDAWNDGRLNEPHVDPVVVRVSGEPYEPGDEGDE